MNDHAGQGDEASETSVVLIWLIPPSRGKKREEKIIMQL